MTAAAGFLAGRHTVLQPSLRSSGSSPRQPHLAAQRRPMHQARPDRRLVGGVAAAAATPATSAAAPQPSAASSANGSQAPDGELAAQAHLQASAARRSAHDGAEPMASSSPPQQHEPAHHHELHDISEHSMRRLRKEMEELRQLMVTQVRRAGRGWGGRAGGRASTLTGVAPHRLGGAQHRSSNWAESVVAYSKAAVWPEDAGSEGPGRRARLPHTSVRQRASASASWPPRPAPPRRAGS